MLVGLGLLLAVSLTVTVVTNAGAVRLVHGVGTGIVPVWWLLAGVGLVVNLAANTVMSIAILTVLPRIRMPLRRILGPALLVAVGLELLKTIGAL